MRKMLIITVLLAVIITGVWALAAPSRLQPESDIRQRAQPASAGGLAGEGLSVGSKALETDLYEAVVPVLVNLEGMPAFPEDYKGMHERWLDGEIDLDERENRVSEAEKARLQQEALALPPNSNVQSGSDSVFAPTPGVSFDSLDFRDSGGSTPPDPEIAVGPNHIIAVVNVAFEIYDKSGNSLGGARSFDNLFSAVAGCDRSGIGLFDPVALYDESTDRYVLGIDGNLSSFCVAVSASGNPTTSWHAYGFPTNFSGALFDYPHAGVGRDAIYMGANLFGGSLPGGFEGRIWAMDKSRMYAGQSMTPVTFSTGGGGGTPQPLDLHGYLQGTWPSSGPHYFVTDQYDGGTVDLWAWDNALSAGTPSVVGTINLQDETGVTGGDPVNFPQLGGNVIQANDWRMRGLEYRDGHAWVTDSISCNPGGGTVDCVRWAEIDLGTRTVVQAGVYGSNGEYRTFPDLAVNRCNDMAIGYSKSSSSSYPAIWYTGRQNSDPAGQLQSEALMKAGERAYSAFDGSPYRWGDYSGMTIDPNGETFWYLGEYSKNMSPTPAANWGTYVGSFTFADCGGVPPNYDYATFLPVMRGYEEPPPPPPPENPIENGDFEAGPAGWSQYSWNGFQLILHESELLVPAQGGEWGAWLGGYYDEISVLQQQVTIPSGSPTLVYWAWIGSQDSCGNDFGGVIINTTVVEVYALCVANNNSNWVRHEVNLSGFAGQTVSLELRAETNLTLNSNLFVDSVSIGGSSAPTAPPAFAGSAAIISKNQAGLEASPAAAPAEGGEATRLLTRAWLDS